MVCRWVNFGWAQCAKWPEWAFIILWCFFWVFLSDAFDASISVGPRVEWASRYNWGPANTSGGKLGLKKTKLQKHIQSQTLIQQWHSRRYMYSYIYVTTIQAGSYTSFNQSKKLQTSVFQLVEIKFISNNASTYLCFNLLG